MNQAYELDFRSIGQDVTIWPQVKVIRPDRITLGNSVMIDDFVFLDGGTNTVLGDFIHLAVSSSVCGGGELIMDDFSGVSGGVRIYTGNDDYFGGSITHPDIPFPYRTPIRGYVHIGKFVIIGANAVILPDVKIGEGAAVGACSVVTRDLLPWMIYAGHPARAIGPRPSAKLQELEMQFQSERYDANGQYIPKYRTDDH